MIKRLFKIIQATVEHQAQKTRGATQSDEFSSNNANSTSNEGFSAKPRNYTKNYVEKQFKDDLDYFGLKPPSSLKDVTTARNREMLKFHPDKFASNSDKSNVANEIALIYNAAFERLKLHYNK